MITPIHRHKRAYQRDTILAIHLHREWRYSRKAQDGHADEVAKHRNGALEAAKYHKAAHDVLKAYNDGLIDGADIEDLHRRARAMQENGHDAC